MWPFKKKYTMNLPVETRGYGSGFTAEIIAARESYIAGRSGIGELTGTVQACVTLWENGLSLLVDGGGHLEPTIKRPKMYLLGQL